MGWDGGGEMRISVPAQDPSSSAALELSKQEALAFSFSDGCSNAPSDCCSLFDK